MRDSLGRKHKRHKKHKNKFGVWHLFYQLYVPDPEFVFVLLVPLVVSS